MTPIRYRGVKLNTRTRDMFEAIEFLTGLDLVITQGSYNAGGVAASAGTHDGGGALDIRAKDLTADDRKAVVAAARRVGFAAWLRTPDQSDWPYHVHCEAIGDPDLSAGAAKQVKAYLKGRNGLAGNGPDDGPRTWVNRTWEIFWEEEMEALLKQIQALTTKVDALTKKLDAHDKEEDLRYGRYEQLFREVKAGQK